MASLVVCGVCQRHVRGHERECPFCGAERTPTIGTSRDVAFARDATRATLIALGLTLAGPACGGKTDKADKDGNRDNVGIVPPYGLSPEGPGEGSDGRGGNGGNEGPPGSGGDSGGDSGGAGGSVPIVPPYGAMPAPTPDVGSGGSADTPDSGTPDAGGDDAGSSETPDPDAGD